MLFLLHSNGFDFSSLVCAEQMEKAYIFTFFYFSTEDNMKNSALSTMEL